MRVFWEAVPLNWPHHWNKTMNKLNKEWMVWYCLKVWMYEKYECTLWDVVRILGCCKYLTNHLSDFLSRINLRIKKNNRNVPFFAHKFVLSAARNKRNKLDHYHMIIFSAIEIIHNFFLIFDSSWRSFCIKLRENDTSHTTYTMGKCQDAKQFIFFTFKNLFTKYPWFP